MVWLDDVQEGVTDYDREENHRRGDRLHQLQERDDVARTPSYSARATEMTETTDATDATASVTAS
jgi:hypothetical protein